MGSRRRSCCLKPSLSASISLWIIFLSALNSQAFTVTTPHCVSGSSPDEPFSRYSYLSKSMSIESVSSLWRSVAQSWPLSAQEDLPVAATLLSTCSIFWVSLRPDLKILWHLPCSLSFGMIVTLPTGKICSLSLLIEPVNEAVKFWNDTPAMKFPMIFFQIQHGLLLLFSESNENSQCVWSFKPHLVKKDYRLWCYPPCSLHSLRYGNAEDQSCLGIVASDGLSELMEVDKLLSNYVHIFLLGVAMGLWPEIKVLINKPLTAIINTSFSIAKIHSLKKQKLVSVYPLNLTTLEKFIQHSSRQGRERSLLSTFSEERTLPPKFISSKEVLFWDSVSEKKIFILTVLHSYVKVCLELLDAARFISMKFEVMDLYSKPRDKLALHKSSEEIKVRLFSFSSIMLGLLGMSLDALSNSSEFVSLSLYRSICVVEVLNLAIRVCSKELICFVLS